MDRVGLALSLGIAIGACDAEPGDEPPTTGDQLRAPPVTVARVASSPGAYEGQTLRIVGEVHDVIDTHVVSLRGRGLLWAPKVYAISRTPLLVDGHPASRDEPVRVIGI